MIRSSAVVLMIAAALFLQACSSSTNAAVPTSPTTIGMTSLVSDLPSPPANSGGETQLVSRSDVLDIRFLGAGELDRTVQVDGRGEIALPLVGALGAEGRSLRDLETSVASAYAQDYLQSPQVSILLKEAAGRQVTIDGAVARAGLYPATASATLLQMLAQGGGFSEIADPTQVLVFRPIGERRFVAAYDVAAIRRGERPDPAVHGGDVIVVPDSASKLARRDLRDILGMARNVGSLAVLGL